jgi:ferredoxin
VNPNTENPDTFAEDPVEGLRRDALAMVEKCIECGSCYVDCAFGNYPDDPKQCRQWIRESNDFILGRTKSLASDPIQANFRCAECNRCFESCPEGIYRRHGNMFMKHLIGNSIRHRVNIHPYSNRRVRQPAIETFVLPKWKPEEQEWYGNLNRIRPAPILLYHGCYVYSAGYMKFGLGCVYCRSCESGRCPTGITTQDPALRRRLDVKERSRQVANLLRVSTNEIARICRLCGCDAVGKLGPGHMRAPTSELSRITKIPTAHEPCSRDLEPDHGSPQFQRGETISSDQTFRAASPDGLKLKDNPPEQRPKLKE